MLPRVAKLVNASKYRHFVFDTGFDTDTRAKRPMFGGGEGGVAKTNVFDTLFGEASFSGNSDDGATCVSSMRKLSVKQLLH